MFTSLRARLLAWYTAILAVVIVLFGAAVCYLAWRNRIADIDAGLRIRAGELAAAVRSAPGGTFDLTLPPDPVSPRGEDPTAIYHALWTPEGVPIDRSDPELAVPMPAGPGARTRDGRREVAIRSPVGPLVLAGRDLSTLKSAIWSLAGSMAAAGALALLVAIAGGWLLVSRALAPIRRISRTAHQMVNGDFAARIPIPGIETELGQLARALNAAFDRLHASLERQRRFTADASHELRTPLATISTESQWALARERQPVEYRESFESCRRATRRMQAVVEGLLALARDESQAAAAHRTEPVRLDTLVADTVRDVGSLAAHRGIDLAVDLTPPATVIGDAERLHTAVTNVIANAIQYNVDGGRVRVTLEPGSSGMVALRVADSGIGIPPDALPMVFEPFFRSDPARSRAAGGAGLGLAIARSVIVSHGGHITCTSEPGAGTEVLIELPAKT